MLKHKIAISLIGISAMLLVGPQVASGKKSAADSATAATTGVVSAAPATTTEPVRGVVKDMAGNPLAGVTVIVKESNSGTVTDATGAYTVQASKGNMLAFSYIGYVSQTVAWSGGTLNISMQEDNVMLEETVVIGYGTVKKKDLSGSVGVLDGNALATQSATQVSQRLQGQIPGLVVTRSSSMPGASASLQIRGVTSLSSSSPLILVDGMPVSSIDDVSSDDIEQISVLKDAASASIYGARAAAGVILITTKSAKEGDTTISYNGEVSFNTLTELPETVGALDYMRMYNEYKWNDAGNAEGGMYPQYSKEYIDNYYTNHFYDPITYPLTDWKKLMLSNYAMRHKHSLVLSYGGKEIKTRASLSYENNDALYTGSNYERIMARIKNNIQFSKKWNADMDISFNHAEKNNTQAGNVIKHAYMYPEIFLGEYPDGRIAEGQSGANSYGALKEGGTKQTTSNIVTGKVALSFLPVEGLKLSASVLPSYRFTKSKDFKKAVPYYDAYEPSVLLGYINGFQSTSLTEGRSDSYSLETQFIANYDKVFAQKHNFNAMVGYEDYYYRYENLSAGSENMELSSFPYLDLANKNLLSVGGDAYENAYRSFFGRVMYNYDSRYYVQANARFDASSRFHPDYRWGFFPSASVAWVISHEKFMQDIRPISHLKLRASIGSLGNERIGNYPYQSFINFESTPMFDGSGTEIEAQKTAAQTIYAIQDITWETTYSWDLGLDMTFFNNRLSLTADYYYKKTKDMLLTAAIPSFTGYADPERNAGTMNTNGWEVKIGWTDQIGDFSYSVGANVSNYKSVMGNLNGTVFDGSTIVREGDEYNAWYGYVSDGLFQTAEEIAGGSALLIANTKPGDVKYKDISGPDGVPDGKITADYDRVILGSSLPKFVYGGYINLGWKGLTLSVTINGVGKRMCLQEASMYQAFEGQWLAPSSNLLGKYWSVYNTPEQNLKAKYPRLTYNSGDTNNYKMSDYWLFNGAYFRVKNINVGYTLPKKWVNKINMKSLRVYASVDDPFSIDNFPTGWDPEATNTTYITRTYTLGLDIKF